MAATRPALVGRSEELAFCEALLSRSESPGLVITGAAGVGKTRLASEVATAAEAMGFASLRVWRRARPAGRFRWGRSPVSSPSM